MSRSNQSQYFFCLLVMFFFFSFAERSIYCIQLIFFLTCTYDRPKQMEGNKKIHSIHGDPIRYQLANWPSLFPKKLRLPSYLLSPYIQEKNDTQLAKKPARKGTNMWLGGQEGTLYIRIQINLRHLLLNVGNNSVEMINMYINVQIYASILIF